AVPPALLHVTAPDAPPRLLSWSGQDRPRLPLRLYDLDAGAGHLAALASVGAPVRPAVHDGSALLAAAVTAADLPRAARDLTPLTPERPVVPRVSTSSSSPTRSARRPPRSSPATA